MLRPQNPPADRRRGVILMVVLALLTLFAVVGITFVFYAQKSHSASVNFREGWQLGFQSGPVDLDPNTLLRYALAQLIYDVDDSSGVSSAIRGHSLARNLYGYNDQTLNLQPFNGTGRLHYPGQYGQDDYNLVNYTYFANDGFLRDPEHYGTRVSPSAARTAPFLGSANPPYSYPDSNFMALAGSRADGSSLITSFWRPGSPFGTLAPNNPNWFNKTQPQLKYETVRPRPADMGAGFPAPIDAGGDVKNRLGAPGGMDSTWMDQGYPVVTAPDGRKFKPLFAWRVEDLDGKVNVNTAGNLRGLNGAHASHEGWGKWEMSLAQLFSANPTEWQNLFLGNASASLPGRYGKDGNPGKAGSSAISGKTPRFFEQVDYDGSNELAGGAPTARLTLPAGLSPFPLFPQGYSNGSPAERLNHPLQYDYFRSPVPPPLPPNATYPYSDDVSLPISDVKYLLYNGATGSDVMNATVAQLCPQNFQKNNRLQGLLTTLSMDFDRMGLSPWLYTRKTSSYGYPTGTNPLNQAPNTTAVQFPSVTARNAATPPDSDFGAQDWRAVFATLERIDLSQNPPSYPHQQPGANYFMRFDTSAAVSQQFLAAQTYRQNLADQIYRRLLIVTGAPSPANLIAPTPAELAPLRWLGQLAVNVVDFIDEDEISTPFNFYVTAYNFFAVLTGQKLQNLPALVKTPSGMNSVNPNVTPSLKAETVYRYWVFGTELPPVVLNEVNTEYVVPTPLKPNLPVEFDVKVWTELYCPFPVPLTPNKATVQAQDNQNTQGIPLYVAAASGQAAYSPYKVVLADNNTVANGPLYVPTVDSSGNAVGTPDQVRNEAIFMLPTTPTVGGGTTATAIPSGTYFLAGADSNDSGGTIKTTRVPPATPWYQSPNMRYTVTQTPTGTWKLGPIASASGTLINDNTKGITVLLRRLANPHLPENTDPTNPLYNPYVTVDYLSNIPLNNGTNATGKGNNYISSYGKLQPYASDNTAGTGKAKSQVQPNVNPTLKGKTPVQHTFGVQNSPITNPATWLTHLDRQPNNPMELLQVSGFRPWQLTQKFILQTIPFQHRTQWFDEDLTGANAGRSHLLYRLFGFLETADRAAGVSRFGRVPGRLNINTVWDPEILLALLDPQTTSNYFTLADVQALWANLLRTRTPNLPSNNTTGGFISQNDRPFLDAAAAFLPPGDLQSLNKQGRGIQDTLFRTATANAPNSAARLFQSSNAAANAHPYLQYEMLTKLANNVTTRSNTFAVWLTVGFFQVMDDTTTPIKLGPEIGYPNTNIRHRFFCVVDRTQIVLAPRLTTGMTAVPAKGTTGPPYASQTITVSPKTSPTDPLNGMSGTVSYSGSSQPPPLWSIQPGSLLVIDRGTPNEEVVQVTAVTAQSFTATFLREHTAGFSITMYGNPGPQPNFDPSADPYSLVVPYYIVLQ